MIAQRGQWNGSSYLDPAGVAAMQQDQTHGAPVLSTPDPLAQGYGYGEWRNSSPPTARPSRCPAPAPSVPRPWSTTRPACPRCSWCRPVFPAQDDVRQLCQRASGGAGAGPAVCQRIRLGAAAPGRGRGTDAFARRPLPHTGASARDRQSVTLPAVRRPPCRPSRRRDGRRSCRRAGDAGRLPRRHGQQPRRARVPWPNTRTFLSDAFRAMDRNHNGVIDPDEFGSGRGHRPYPTAQPRPAPPQPGTALPPAGRQPRWQSRRARAARR